MTGTDYPLVSVIIPYYNGKEFIREAIQSVLDQTYKNIEIILVNDASTNTEDSEYIEKLSSQTDFKLITNKINKGISKTLAEAAEASGGKYIAELSQDDLYKPEKIERQIKELNEKNLDAVYAVGDILHQENRLSRKRDATKTKKIIESSVAREALMLQNLPCISIQGLLARRSVFEKDIIPIWKDYLLDDWPVNIRLFEQYKVGFIDVPLWTARAHTQNTSHDIWKWLGPQIEVISRMTPLHLKTEGISDRLGSMARRLLKKNGDLETIIRFAFASIILSESSEQHIKASRVLNKMPAKLKKEISVPKIRLIEDAANSQQNKNFETNNSNINWQNLGKEISKSTEAFQGNEVLNEIAKHFVSLAYNISDNTHFNKNAIKFILAALLLSDKPQQELKIKEMISSIRQEYKYLLKEKCRFLKAKSSFSFRHLWLKQRQ